METLKSILWELHPELDYDREQALIDDGLLDSFDIVTLVAEIDGEFGVAVPPEELTPENFNSAGSIWALICRLREG